MKNRIALVIGAGAFGTAMASVLSLRFQKVILKVRSRDVYQSIKNHNQNPIYLPNLPIPPNVLPILDWAELSPESEKHIDLLINGLPTSGIRPFYSHNRERFLSWFERGIPFVSLSKGIHPETLEMADDFFFDLFPKHQELFTFLSGPSFAREIMQKQITLVTLAGHSLEHVSHVRDRLETFFFKCTSSDDVKGVLLGGALKNVIAIAGGIIEGLGYNHNTRAALITRAIAEMLKFGSIYNARTETFYGPSGMGDLILSTSGGISRNRQLGLALAKGESPKKFIEKKRDIVEGYKTAYASHIMGKKHGISAPIFEGVYQILYEGRKPHQVLEQIMQG